MAFDINTARPISSLPAQKGGFDISTATPVEAEDSISDILLAGGFGRGAQAAKRGAGLKDLPFLVAKSFSGALGTIPERIAERPLSGFTQVLPYKKKLFPRPSTIEGEKLGGELEFLSGLIPLEAVGSQVI